MLYGPQKTKSIARSVLPAGRNRAQSAAKDKRNASQRRRSTARQNLSEVYAPGAYAEDVTDDFDDYCDPWIDTVSPAQKYEVSDIVAERRLADNLGALTRWTASMKDDFDDPADLIAYLSNELPDNLAGRHALSHMETKFGPEDRQWFRYHTEPVDPAVRERRWAMEYAIWEHVITAVFEADLKGLNREIKAVAGSPSVLCSTKLPGPRRRFYGTSRFCGALETETLREFWRRKPPYESTRTVWVRTAIPYTDWWATEVTCERCGKTTPTRGLHPLRNLDEIPEFIGHLHGGTPDSLKVWIRDRYEILARKAA